MGNINEKCIWLVIINYKHNKLINKINKFRVLDEPDVMLLLFLTLAAIHLVVAYHAIIVKFNAILFIIIVIIWMTKHVALLVIRWGLVSLTL